MLNRKGAKRPLNTKMNSKLQKVKKKAASKYKKAKS